MLSSTVMVAAVPVEPVLPVSEHDAFVLLKGATWADYRRLVELRGEASVPRISYLEGCLELMSPSRHHETIASVIGCLIEAWCMDQGLDLTPAGSWTLENEEAERGLEPDECYVFGDAPIDDWDRPDLAIEVVWSSGGLSKLEIYRKLGVPEVWTWKKGVLHVHVLDGERYLEVEASRALPDIDLARVAELATVRPMTRAVRALRSGARTEPEPGSN